ncbi:hypothetical protein Pcinc_000574 [Petrolisthes cinctipes]|uniref:RNase H type-1 domain-containing protein n=1 Tax=Petrolisthes cinctipes TaxID=88211 RepID=A0AAE1GPG0_PETCI|nr:hypothetical protein Pcinc_000574 [Petrolisthes cinctipes]
MDLGSWNLLMQPHARWTTPLSPPNNIWSNRERAGYQHLITQILRQLATANASSLVVHFLWIPSHVGLLANNTADRLAKAACHLDPPDADAHCICPVFQEDESLKSRCASITSRFEAIGSHLDSIETRFDSLVSSFDILTTRFATKDTILQSFVEAQQVVFTSITTLTEKFDTLTTRL